MGNFFESLVSENLIEKWAKLIDWLLNDERFSEKNGWTKGYIGLFIKNVKNSSIAKNSNYLYGKRTQLTFSNKRTSSFKIIHAKRDSESRDLIRHIRNGIAHGKSFTLQHNGDLWVEISDYKTKDEQTAYIFVPLSFIFSIYRIYMDVEKKAQNANKKKRRT